MSFTSAVLPNDDEEEEEVRKNGKVGKRNDFSHFLENEVISEALSGKWGKQKSSEK